MPDTGWKPVTVAVSDSTGAGAQGWSASTGTLSSAVATQDTAYALAGDVSAGVSTNWLYGRAPDMSAIPSGATITGIEARLRSQSASDATSRISNAYFRKTTTGGANVGSNLAASPQNMPGAYGSLTFGSPSSLSGGTYSLAEVQAAGFGFAFYCTNIDAKFQTQPRVDLIEIRVTYTEAAGSPPTITSITPDNVPAGGGTLVTINGTGLASGTVLVGGTSPVSTTIGTSTQLQIVTAEKTEGLHDVSVTTGGGSVTRTNGLRFLGSSGNYSTQRNRVRETATITGTGSIFLTGAYSAAHRTFLSQVPPDSVVKYMALNENGEYEVGLGLYSATANSITRSFIEESSNRNAIVSFSAGAKDVILCETAGNAGVINEYRNILENASLTFFQRQAPGTEKSLADGEYGPDRWYVLTQSAAIGVTRTTGIRPYLSEASAVRMKQTNATAQRFGIAQRVWSHESIGLRGKRCRLQATLYASTTARVNWAVLEWTGTADSVTRDPVLSWTSSVFTPGNFFLASNYNVIGTGQASSVGASAFTVSEVLALPFSSSLNNVVVMFWMDSAATQNFELSLCAPMLIDDVYPRLWKKPNRTDELMRCLASYAKSFLLESNPATAAFAGAKQYIATTAINGQEIVDFRVEMRKTPTVNVFSPQTGTAGKCYQYPAAADLNMGTEIVSTNGFWVYATPASTQVVRYQWTADADQ